MVKTVGIGYQKFEQVITDNAFYIDKTSFIKEWWENLDIITLITRPRRFGKTLTMSMVESFFSIKYKDKSRLFEGLTIWNEEKYRNLQGSYPIISLSFANVKETDYERTRQKICYLLAAEYAKNAFLLEGDLLTEQEKLSFRRVSADMGDVDATMALNQLCGFLARYYHKNVIILLDEYDTPMQEAYVYGFWEELTSFTRSLFNAAFKTNEYLERAILTGITRVSKESVFSDLNNLVVITTTSDMYADCFGFTEEEVFAALKHYGLEHCSKNVKEWYDGFTFGNRKDIYNPWSILNFIKMRKLDTYWANTSSNSLVSKLIREGNRSVKCTFEELLNGKSIHVNLDEQIVYSQLDNNPNAIWSLLLASGYLKVEKYEGIEKGYMEGLPKYELKLTNLEVQLMFRSMVKGWFGKVAPDYNDFVTAMLLGDVKAMNRYMNQVALTIFSYFDTGNDPSRESEPERFYHGFVLGLVVELAGRYEITSNRESGFGRYDVMLVPENKEDPAIIMEFKVLDSEEEKTLQDTVEAALKQIEDKKYAVSLENRGIRKEKISCYGFAFRGKQVKIGKK